MVAAMAADRLSARSRQAAVGTLKAATAWAARPTVGLVPVDPLSDFHRPSLKGDAAGTVKAWSVHQARQFVVSAAGDRFAACWALMITRGLRRGELVGLRWSAVDLDNRRLTVKVARVVVKAKVIDSLPKSGVGRTIPLDDMLVTKLRELRAVQDVEAEIAAEAYENRTDPYVMADGRGRPMHPDSISRRFDELVAKVGLPRLTVHGLRHTTATLMLSAGFPTKVVSDLLGHSSTTITNAIYSRVPPGMSEQAGEKLSSATISDQEGVSPSSVLASATGFSFVGGAWLRDGPPK